MRLPYQEELRRGLLGPHETYLKGEQDDDGIPIHSVIKVHSDSEQLTVIQGVLEVQSIAGNERIPSLIKYF